MSTTWHTPWGPTSTYQDPNRSTVDDTEYAVRWQHAIDKHAGRAFARELLAQEYASPKPRYTLIRFLKTKR